MLVAVPVTTIKVDPKVIGPEAEADQEVVLVIGIIPKAQVEADQEAIPEIILKGIILLKIIFSI